MWKKNIEKGSILDHAPKAKALLLATGVLIAATFVAGWHFASELKEKTDFKQVGLAELEMFGLAASAFATRKASYSVLKDVSRLAWREGQGELAQNLSVHKPSTMDDHDQLPVGAPMVAAIGGFASNAFARIHDWPHGREAAGMFAVGCTALAVTELSGVVSDYKTLTKLSRPSANVRDKQLAT